MRLINADKLIDDLSDLKRSPWANEPWLSDPQKLGILEAIDMIQSIVRVDSQTVDAVPISFIEKRIEQLKSHADYEFEANGGYAGGSQYRLWELECLLDAWTKRREG